MSLQLHPHVAKKGILPTEYVLQVTDTKPANTFIFSEKDLPGYSSRQRAGPRINGGAAGSSSSRLMRQSQGPQGIDKNRRGQGRRGVPSKLHLKPHKYSTYVAHEEQTALAGRIKQEVSCSPVDNGDYKQAMEKRAAEAAKKMKPKLELIEGLPTATGGGMMGLGAPASFDSFIVCSTQFLSISGMLTQHRKPRVRRRRSPRN